MATGGGSAQVVPYDMWVEEEVDHYRLKESDLLKFLQKILGNYDKRLFSIQRGEDAYTFYAPRELTEDEKDTKLEAYRWKKPLRK